MNATRTNVRIATGFRPGIGVESYGEYCLAFGDAKRLEQIKADLADVQKIEPRSGWKLQARGEQTDWHDWNAVNEIKVSAMINGETP